MLRPRVLQHGDDHSHDNTTLQGYTYPPVAFQTGDLVDHRGVSLSRHQLLSKPNVHKLHKMGLRTTQAVEISNSTQGFNIYTQVRFNHASLDNSCHVKDAALSIFYGAVHVGGQVGRLFPQHIRDTVLTRVQNNPCSCTLPTVCR